MSCFNCLKVESSAYADLVGSMWTVLLSRDGYKIVVFFEPFVIHQPSADFGGLKWTRTTDLALIRRTL